MRSGFTLLEVLLAVVLINVGLLALVAGSALLVRQSSDVATRSNAQRAATNRVQLLGASPCRSTTGTAEANGIREQWTVGAPRHDVREITDSVSFATHTGRHSLVVHSHFPC